MKIKISYSLRKLDTGNIWTYYNTVITEAELEEMLKQRFKDGELPCPINLNRETSYIDDISVDNIEL